MRVFKDNMKFLDRLRNSKGTLDMSKFADFERQHKAYKKNLQESTNHINSIANQANPSSLYQVRSTSVSKGLEIGLNGHTTETSFKGNSGAGGLFNRSIQNSQYAMNSTNRTTHNGANGGNSSHTASAERLPSQVVVNKDFTGGLKLPNATVTNSFNIPSTQLYTKIETMKLP
jgi:hypothetical protein